MQIFYLCPNYVVPSGGVLRLYTHVRILRDAGYEAFIVRGIHESPPSWFEHDVPVRTFADMENLQPEDLMVVPEGRTVVLRRFSSSRARKVVLSLNPLYSFRYLPDWGDYDIQGVMTNCLQTKAMIEWATEISPVHYVETGIDSGLFTYNPEEKRLQVSYIKRKDHFAPLVERVLRMKSEGSDVAFTPIENLHHKAYARVLQQSAIFLCTSTAEGFPRSMLEAMACGCVCVGFHGIGGRDHIISSGEGQNFVLVESMNFIDLAQTLSGVIQDARSQAERMVRIRKNSMLTSSALTKEKERDSLLDFWTGFTACGSELRTMRR